MSLADSIYEANAEVVEPSLLEELVDMAVGNSVRDRPDELSIHQLHLRGDQIYRGQEALEETTTNVYRLTEYDNRIPPHTAILFWQKLKPRLPVLDKRVIQISTNLFWDKEKGEIVNYEEICDRYGLAEPNDETSPSENV